MICVDASVAVKWILDEELSDLALALYMTALQSGEAIVVPPLLPIEVTNILRQRVRARDGVSPAEALLLLDKFLNFPLDIRHPAGLHRQALILANVHDLPAAYDAPAC